MSNKYDFDYSDFDSIQKTIIIDDMEQAIRLFLANYNYSEDTISLVNELKDTEDVGNLKMAIALLEENKDKLGFKWHNGD